MRVIIVEGVVALALAACGSSSECEPTWAIPVFRGASGDEGADAHARVAPDGSIVVTLADPFDAIRYGDELLPGAHLSRVAADGTIVRTVEAGPGPYGNLIGLDGASRPTVVWGFQEANVVAYDEDLRVRWQHPLGIAAELAFAVGPGGDVAVQDRDAGGQLTSLRVFDGAGAERWHHDDTYPHRLGFLASGDLVSIESDASGPYRRVYRLSDGMIVAERREPAGVPDLITADGSSVNTGFVDDRVAFVERHDAAGARLWRHELEARGVTDATEAANGDTLVVAYGEITGSGQRIEAVRLDSVTGEELSRLELCSAARLAGGDARGVVTIGPIGSPSRGLARFE